MSNTDLKRTLKALVNTPFMPAGMYSQDCRDERHWGRCSNCECWCHLQAALDRIAEALASPLGAVERLIEIDRILRSTPRVTRPEPDDITCGQVDEPGCGRPEPPRKHKD